MDPLPYNITIPSQAGTVIYTPTRDGNIEDGWSVTYSNGLSPLPAFASTQGVGTDYHQTTHDGSSMQFSWVGTAMYLYGQASDATFSIDVDGDATTSTNATIPVGGLLGTRTDLPYGNHTATLTTQGTGLVGFQCAELTIGVGYPGSSVQNRTILAVDPNGGLPMSNSFFSFHTTNVTGSWNIQSQVFSVQPNGSSVPVPLQMSTIVAGESVTFTLNETTAFFLRGAANHDHGLKSVTFTPQSNPSQAKTTFISDYSSLLSFDTILYWESGLDRDQSYIVQVTPLAAGSQLPPGSSGFSFSELDVIDGGSTGSDDTNHDGSSDSPFPSGLTLGAPTAGSTETAAPTTPVKANGLSTAATVGISVASCIAGVAVLAVLVLFWLRRRRPNYDFPPELYQRGLEPEQGLTGFVGDFMRQPMHPSVPPAIGGVSPFTDVGDRSPLNVEPPQYSSITHEPSSKSGSITIDLYDANLQGPRANRRKLPPIPLEPHLQS